MNAETTVLWQSETDEGVLIDWSSAAVAADNVELSAGQIIVVSVAKVVNDDGKYPQFTLVTPVGDAWSWTDLENVQCSEAGDYTIELTDAMIENISSHKRIFLKGDAIYVTKMAVETGVDYEETGTAIEFDEYGNILASQFDGFDDDARVQFIVEATGEAVDGDGHSVLNWGIGNIKSLKGNVTVGNLSLKQIGDNVYNFTIADLKAALADEADDWGRQGICWSVWAAGNATCARKSVTVYKVKAAEQPADEYTVAGVESVFGTNWDINDANNLMTTEDNVNYTLVLTDVTLEKNVDYTFKVVKNHSWDTAYPASNYVFKVDETAKYTITIGFNAETTTITVGTEKTGDAVASEHAWGVVGTLVGSWDNDVFMTLNGEGIYTAVIENVAAGSYEFKVRADGAWNINYPSSNYIVTVTTSGSTVTVFFNPDTHEVSATVSEPTAIDSSLTENRVATVRYNMAGQKVTGNYHGVVIENGRKIVVK